MSAAPRKDEAEIVVTGADDAVDPFLAFDSEDDDAHPTAATPATGEAPIARSAPVNVAVTPKPVALVPAAAPVPARTTRGTRVLLMVVSAIAIAAAAGGLTYAYLEWSRRAAAPGVVGPVVPPPTPPTPAASEGTVQVTSQPEGAKVSIDGTARGVTPLRLSLAAGSHVIEVEHQESRRSVPLTLEAAATSSHYFDFTSAAPATGRLEVRSEPSGATVSIDGTSRGVTPLVLPAMPSGTHRVVISNRNMTATRTVTVAPGATATLVVPLARAVATTGFVSVQAPVDLDVFLEGTKVGTSATNVRLPAGRHTLELLNASLEFRTNVTVEIPAGGTTAAVVTVPKGKLSINAIPWAEILLDGRPIGQTPLANLDVPIGSHEVIWRHPQLGERRQTVVIRAQSPTRVGMDLNNK